MILKCIKVDVGNDINITLNKIYETFTFDIAPIHINTYQIIDDNNTSVSKFKYKFEEIDTRAAKLLYSRKL